MKPNQSLKDKITTLHDVLNEMYALDTNWRNWGNWPPTVTGSTLYPAATTEEIAEAESRVGHPFPPSYKEFLNLHGAWEHFWGDFTLTGIATQEACEEILENIDDQKSDLRKKLGDAPSEAAITAWEAEEERHLYLAKHLVIGTDFSGAHWVFDTNTRRGDGEMTLTHWDISYGAQDPQFPTFHDFLCRRALKTAAIR